MVIGALLGLLTFVLPPAAIADASAGVSVAGVVLRSPADVSTRVAPLRYRTRRDPAADDDPLGESCACDAQLFAVVHLTGDVLPPARSPVQPPQLVQKNRRFNPSVIAIQVGEEVEFPNRDPFFHNVFSYSRSRKFDLGRYPAGETAFVRFPESGVVAIFCEIHYSMRAYVHVLDTPYFDVTDGDRRFEIRDVEPGEYVLHVWQEKLPELTIPITVTSEPLYVEAQ